MPRNQPQIVCHCATAGTQAHLVARSICHAKSGRSRLNQQRKTSSLQCIPSCDRKDWNPRAVVGRVGRHQFEQTRAASLLENEGYYLFLDHKLPECISPVTSTDVLANQIVQVNVLGGPRAD